MEKRKSHRFNGRKEKQDINPQITQITQMMAQGRFMNRPMGLGAVRTCLTCGLREEP
jgi:hypothetical protein